MNTSDQQQAGLWKPPSTAKAKGTVQRAVTALLDGLAPEPLLKRSESLPAAIEQHRTPTGCVLQAPKAALSVSWFTGAGNDPLLGELRVMVWRGVVSRRGSPRRKEGSTVVREIVLRPIEDPSDDRLWRADDNTEYGTTELAAFCTRLLEKQVASTS
jgi:hypothetical protein